VSSTPSPIAIDSDSGSGSGSDSDSDSSDGNSNANAIRNQIKRSDSTNVQYNGVDLDSVKHMEIDPDTRTLVTIWIILFAVMCVVSGVTLYCLNKKGKRNKRNLLMTV